MPRLDLYDGSSDPLEFLRTYRRTMVIRNAFDATMCKAFSAYLKKNASNWFSRLLPNSIESFHELGKEFVAYFINSRSRKKSTGALLALRQGKDETLQKFIGWFRVELHQINEPNFEMVRAALYHAIRDRDMKVALNDEHHRSPNHHAECSRQRALDQEEAPKITRNIDTIYGGPASGGLTEEGHAHYAEHINSIEKPSKKSKADPSTCVTVTFTDADYRTIDRQHDDAIVVRLTIANCNVGRILVDTGSSVNVLHQDAFAKMDISSDKLEPVVWSIYGFSGGEVKVRRKIKLPITSGNHLTQRTIMQTFVIVCILSTYNGIIGRPALNELEAVVSIADLKIKFPTKLGVGQVNGDQEKARECYAALLKKKKAAKETFSIGGIDP
ncbi:uncharacterized protein LOC143855457 [Tasmannia lanceolata]|uniref:uncharacterized protein LOC143855457 n=1 Tax=Tasmannia lanceolata TaxID=3420 RepID=UPI00406325FA